MFNKIEKIYEKFRLSPADLSIAEREELDKLFNQLPEPLSLGDFEQYIEKSIFILENDLFVENAPKNIFGAFFNRKQRLHKEARLRNYIEIREILARPERAREHLEKQMKKLAKNS